MRQQSGTDVAALGARPRRAPERASTRLSCAIAALLVVVACGHDDPLADAIALQSKGRYVESIEPLRQLIAERPDDPQVNYRFGLALLADQQYGMAVWPLRRASESPEYAVSAGLELAWAAHQNGAFDDAIGAATAVLEHEPDNLKALLVRGKSHLAANREEAALADFARMEEIDDDLPDIWIPRALALARLGRVQEAGTQIQQIRELEKGESATADPMMCALVGVFTHESGDSETAEKTFEECLTEYPNSGVVVKQAVDFFDDTERPERGNEILRAVVARSPERSDARALLAERLRASGAAEEAEQILRAGTEIDASPAPWISLTLHYEALKDPARAREAMEQALQRMPRVPPDVIFAYADICVRAGAYDEALAQVAKLEWPGFAPLIRGRVAFERGDYATALREFDTGIQTWPDNPGLRQLAGRAAEQLGNFDRAIAEYREALRTESAATDAGLDLARLYEAMGNPGGAFTALALHHKMHPNDPDALERSIPLVARAGLEDTVKAQVEALRKFGSPARAVAARADLALRAGKPERAVELVRAASLDLDAAENDPALRVLTRALLDAGRVEEAQRIVEAAVRARPQDPGCLALWGGTLEADAPAAARAAFQRALDADPDHAAARVGMARLEARGSDDDAALRSYGLALAADAENADAAWGAIAIVEARGDAAEFERRLRARLRANPRDGKAALKLAQLLLASKPDAARELARRAALLGTGPESAETLASAQLALGRPDAAIEVLETVIERHPERAAARYRLGLAQAAAGNSRAAATALREALDTGGFPEVDDARQRLAALESASATP